MKSGDTVYITSGEYTGKVGKLVYRTDRFSRNTPFATLDNPDGVLWNVLVLFGESVKVPLSHLEAVPKIYGGVRN